MQTGVNVDLAFDLKVATVEETVTVTAETPIVDTKKLGTATNVGTDELYKVPQARDPWAVLRTIPGVIAGPREHRRQRERPAGRLRRPRARTTTTPVVGTSTASPITDMAATGASPTYFDYDAFDEINVSTGGNDVEAGDRRHRPELRDQARHQRLPRRRTLLPHPRRPPVVEPARRSCSERRRASERDGSFRDKADHIQQISDYGADLGGPVVKDKLWFYGSYGVQDIRIVRAERDRRTRRCSGATTPSSTGRPARATRSRLFWFRGSKIKEGRARRHPGLHESDSFLWNQDDARRDGTPPGCTSSNGTTSSARASS